MDSFEDYLILQKLIDDIKNDDSIPYLFKTAICVRLLRCLLYVKET